MLLLHCLQSLAPQFLQLTVSLDPQPDDHLHIIIIIILSQQQPFIMSKSCLKLQSYTNQQPIPVMDNKQSQPQYFCVIMILGMTPMILIKDSMTRIMMILPYPLSSIVSSSRYARILRMNDPMRLKSRKNTSGTQFSEPCTTAWIVELAPMNMTWQPEVAEATLGLTWRFNIVRIRMWPQPAAIIPVMKPARVPPQHRITQERLTERSTSTLYWIQVNLGYTFSQRQYRPFWQLQQITRYRMNIVRKDPNNRKNMDSQTSNLMSFPQHNNDMASKKINMRKLLPIFLSFHPLSQSSSFINSGSTQLNTSDSVSCTSLILVNSSKGSFSRLLSEGVLLTPLDFMSLSLSSPDLILQLT